jgi:hypothetical protein
MTATAVSVTPSSILVRSDDVLHQEVGGEAVLLDLASETYFALDPVGTRIWELLDGRPLDAILHTLCDEYDAAPARIEADLLQLAASLADAGLIRVR